MCSIDRYKEEFQGNTHLLRFLLTPERIAVGQWHDVLLEVNGNDLVAQVDGQKFVATSSVADAMKNRIGVGLTGRGAVLIDNVRV